MMQSVFNYLNENPAILVGAMCLIGVAFVIVFAIDGKNRRKMRRKIRQLKEAVETKERVIVHQQKRIKDLKTEIFALGMDKKISEEKLEKRIQQLEMDKKQLLKWEGEK